jgi:hypothetical protein
MAQFQKLLQKCISYTTRPLHTLSAAGTVRVSHALPAVRFSCLLRGRGTSFQDGVAAGEGVLCAPFWSVQNRLQCSVSFVRGLKKTHHTRITYFFKPFTELTLHCFAFLGVQISDYSEAWVSSSLTTVLDTAKRSTQKAFSCCDSILETGLAAPQ